MTASANAASAGSEIVQFMTNLGEQHAEVALREWFGSQTEVVVAFSGGADSALLAWIANDVLGQRARVVTAISPSLAGEEERACRDLAANWGLRWSTVTTDEMESAAYRQNGPDRCFHCKDALMRALAPMADGAVVVLGVNTDDLDDHRPGQDAARMAGALFPYVDCGIDKAMVRAISRRLGLETWDKPAMACLASRVPHGMEVNVRVLSRVERAEMAVRRVVTGDVRVRHHGDVARIEVGVDHIPVLLAAADVVASQLRELGYRYVCVDIEGFRSGSLNP
jgi:uncharacterized protein